MSEGIEDSFRAIADQGLWELELLGYRPLAPDPVETRRTRAVRAARKAFYRGLFIATGDTFYYRRSR